MRIEELNSTQRMLQAYSQQTDLAAVVNQSKIPQTKRVKTQGKDNLPENRFPDSDRLTLSKLGQDLARITKAVNEDPSSKEKRIEELRQAIANGKYEIGEGQLADKILEHFFGL